MQIYKVDTFTMEPFRGNPAAVCFLPEPKDSDWLQNVAREMNLPATAFLQKNSVGYQLRWFTPTTEMQICGHGTLASTHVLYETNKIDKDKSVTFFTKSGELTATFKEGWVELNFPSIHEEKTTAPKELIQALGVQAKYVGQTPLDYIVEVEGEDVVRNLKPDLDLIAQLPVRGVIVTSASHSGAFDFVSRFFSPAQGIEEDAVTGSAHCCLALIGRNK